MARRTRKRSKHDQLIYKAHVRHEERWHRSPAKSLCWKHKGGGELSVGQNIFEYNETIDGKTVTITSTHLVGLPECFMLKFEVYQNQTYAILSSVSGVQTCAPSKHATTIQMIQSIIQLAKERGAKWMDIQDDSTICEKSQFLSLSDYYFLTRGQTWYETIARFIPERQEEIDYYREKVTTNTWEYVMTNFARANRRKYKEFMSEIIPLLGSIETSALAMNVLKSIPLNSRCYIFNKYMAYLLPASDISSIKGYVWYLPFSSDIQRESQHYRIWNTEISVEKYE
jgi:hypothetical protein